MSLRHILALTVALMLPERAAADAPVPVDLAPIPHAAATLTVVAPDGTARTYTPAELEQFTTYRMTTTTPWRQDDTLFEGVLLQDILAASSLAEVPAIKVTAENDFVSIIPAEALSTGSFMVATRMNGQAHTRRERGPIQFVVDDDAMLSTDLISESHLVWMAQRIEAE